MTRFIIDRVLNHTDATVGGVYDRFTYTDERMDAVTELTLCSAPNVAPFAARREQRTGQQNDPFKSIEDLREARRCC